MHDNDNDPSRNVALKFQEIFESFAPSYSEIYSQAASVRNQIRASLLLYLFTLSISWITALNNPKVLLEFNIFTVGLAFSVLGLWNVHRLERIGRWKLDYKPISRLRVPIPVGWRFEPASVSDKPAGG